MELHHVCNWRLPICSRTVTAGKDSAIPRHLALKKTFVLIDFPNNIHEILKNANRFREKHFASSPEFVGEIRFREFAKLVI